MKKQLFTLWILAALTTMATFVSCEKDPLPEPTPEPTSDHRWTWAGEYYCEGDIVWPPRTISLSVIDTKDSLMDLAIPDWAETRQVVMHTNGTFAYEGPYSSNIYIEGLFYAGNDSLHIWVRIPERGYHELYAKKVCSYSPSTTN